MAKKTKIPAKKVKKPPVKSHKTASIRHSAGRPAQYKPEYNEQVLKLCLLGATDKDIADFFGVSTRTLNTWKKHYPEFLHSIKKGKEQADTNVASALYTRATGFTKKDCEKMFQYRGEIVRATVKEYFPPDVTAAIFWLKNRQPGKWREKQTQVIENPDGTALFSGIDIKIVKTKKEIEDAAE
ncbi:MAG: helix-turn-helix domain-containing protein [Prevotellaceae bacterium]|jgi:DNA-binding CsgD family transcriptional regulator|nr:helix-turn-helix domain-containing protein [Prevotellaceae bacterium]